jgi:hypothetical protein
MSTLYGLCFILSAILIIRLFIKMWLFQLNKSEMIRDESFSEKNYRKRLEKYYWQMFIVGLSFVLVVILLSLMRHIIK